MLVIEAKDNHPDNIYVQNIYLNGVVIDKNSISYEKLILGGTITFEMGSEPAYLNDKSSKDEKWYDFSAITYGLVFGFLGVLGCAALYYFKSKSDADKYDLLPSGEPIKMRV